MVVKAIPLRFWSLGFAIRLQIFVGAVGIALAYQAVLQDNDDSTPFKPLGVAQSLQTIAIFRGLSYFHNATLI